MASQSIWLSAPFSQMLWPSQMLWGPMIGQLLALKEGLGKQDMLVERLATTEIVVIFEPDKSSVNAGWFTRHCRSEPGRWGDRSLTCYRGSPRGYKKGGCEGHKKGKETEKRSFDFVVWETPQKITRREKLKKTGEPAPEAAVTFTCGGSAASRRRPRSLTAAGRRAEWRRRP